MAESFSKVSTPDNLMSSSRMLSFVSSSFEIGGEHNGLEYGITPKHGGSSFSAICSNIFWNGPITNPNGVSRRWWFPISKSKTASARLINSRLISYTVFCAFWWWLSHSKNFTSSNWRKLCIGCTPRNTSTPGCLFMKSLRNTMNNGKFAAEYITFSRVGGVLLEELDVLQTPLRESLGGGSCVVDFVCLLALDFVIFNMTAFFHCRLL